MIWSKRESKSHAFTLCDFSILQSSLHDGHLIGNFHIESYRPNYFIVSFTFILIFSKLWMFVYRRSIVILVLLSPTMILALPSGRMSPLQKSLIARMEVLGQRNGQGTTTMPHAPSLYLICQENRLHYLIWTGEENERTGKKYWQW